MKTVQILEADDKFLPDDWCRPLRLSTMSGGMSDSMSFKSCYSGTPENNVKWVRVRAVLGKPWFGHTVGQYNTGMGATGDRFEFVRGDVPESHRLDMGGYHSLAN